MIINYIYKNSIMMSILKNEVITLTFGDAGENHVGMEMIGEKKNIGEGFNLLDLQTIQKKFEDKNYICEFFHLNDLYKNVNKEHMDNENIEDAYLLVIRNGMNYFLKNTDNLIKEMNYFEWDKKYYDTRRKKVLNKHARSNVCFNIIGNKPDYENKKGTVISYDNVKYLNSIRQKMVKIFGNKSENMICEGNRYFDLKNCGIGWHGDSERRKVIGMRLGETMPLCFNWFYQSKSIGNILQIELNNTDIYVMSEKTTGNDWKYRSKYTLRHSAGSKKYLALKK